jgi:hypothetical protein
MIGQIHFTTGKLFLGTDEVGELKDVSLDFASTTKPYKGRKQVTRFKIVTEKKISGKASSGHLYPDLIAKVAGATVDAGAGPFTLTVGDETISTAKKATISNADVALAPTYRLVLMGTDAEGQNFGLDFFAVTLEKAGVALKIEDFGDSSIDFDAQANGDDEVGEVFFE